MNNKKWKYYIFFIAYTIYIFYQLFYMNSNIKLVFPLPYSIIYFIYALFIIKIASSKFSLKSLSIFWGLIILSLIIYKCSGELKIFELLLIIYAARDIDFSSIAKWTRRFLILGVLTIIIMSLVGIIPNNIFYREDGTERISLGFVYVSQLPNIFLVITFLDIFITEKDGKNISIIKIIIYTLINFAIYKITDVRNTFYIFILFLILYCVKRIRASFFEKKLVQLFMTYSYLILFGVSLIMSSIYNPQIEWHGKLNEYLNNRLLLTNRTLENYSINLFGNNIPMYGINAVLNGGHSWNEYSYIDNAYMQILLKYGIIISILISASYTIFIKKAFQRKNFLICIWFFIMAISSVTADSMINIVHNCVILLLFNSLKQKDEYKEKNVNLIYTNTKANIF